MSKQTFNTRKGQSAIEYLMTYGWMLLVVAIVGGAIFMTVQGQCLEGTSGFEATEVAVTDFEVGEYLQLEVTNNAGEQVMVEDIYVGDTVTTFDEELGNGESTVFDITDLSAQEGTCNDFDISVQYERGEFDSANSTGTLTGEMA